MDGMLALRCALELLMIVPAAVFMLTPLWRRVRRPRAAVPAAALLCLLAAGVGGALCARSGVGAGGALILSMAGASALTLFFSRAPVWKAAFCCVNAAMLCAFCRMYSLILAAPFELGNADPVLTLPGCLIRLGLTAGAGLLFRRTLARKLPDLLDEGRIDQVWPELTALSAGMTVFYWWATPISAAVIMTGRVRPISMLLFLFLPAFTMVLLHLLWWITRRMADSARLEQEMRLLQAESQRYREFRENMESTRTLRHDFRQHLHVIASFVGERQYDRLEEYLKQFERKAPDSHELYCANPAVDAIVAYYARQAADADVRLETSLRLPKALAIDETDLCVLIGNLMENALQAAQALPREERQLRVIAEMLTGAMLGLSIENPYAGTLETDASGFPASAREDHGIGLLSASAVVNRYHGTMEIRTENHLFSVSILMYL